MAALAGFALAFAIELMTLAVLRRVLDPDPQGAQPYLAYVFIGCAVVAAGCAGIAGRGQRRFDVGSAVGASLLLVLASWALWFAAFQMACGGTQTPFFAIGCD